MKKNLEDFVRTNRASLDQAQPDLKVWAGIDQALDRKNSRRIRLWRPFAAAASVALLVGLGTIIGWQLNNQQNQRSLSSVAPELEEMQEYYESQLEEKTAILANYQADPSVKEDLSQLESFLTELQTELLEAPRDKEEQIINAMIENYQDRLDILERVLSRIQSNNRESQKLNNDEEISL